MKQAKFALTAVAILAVIGGALAFKANRQAKLFYSLGTTLIDGEEKEGCVVSVPLSLTQTIAGGVITPYSTTFNAPTTTCTARVTPNA